MQTVLVTISILLWAVSILLIFKRQILAPVAAYSGLLTIGLSETLPINNAMLIGWLCMTLVVTAATAMQPDAVRQQTRGLGYITVGALTGMSIGLLAFSSVPEIAMRYGIMIIACIAGIFFGFFLFTTTPAGKSVGIRSGNFFTYLLAKGFPTAITIIQIGIAIVLFLAINNQQTTI